MNYSKMVSSATRVYQNIKNQQTSDQRKLVEPKKAIRIIISTPET